jgi:flagellar hook-associated protein 1 FlgK
VSSFAGLSTALSSLIAQRQALEVAGQNVSNANTPGYTRQRVEMQAVQALSAPTMFSSTVGAGNGVKVISVERLGDIYLDARLRAETSTASYTAERADVLGRLQTTLTEPADTGLSSTLSNFWASWQDVANSPHDPAARKVVIGAATNLVTQIADGYRAVQTQWSQARTTTDTLVTEVNTTAASVAHLNEQIRSIIVSGGSANELMDQRDQLITKLSGLVGAEARLREDGTVDVMVDGNALVRGVKANEITVQGSHTMGTAIAVGGDPVRLAWAGTGTGLSLSGGRIAALLEAVAPSGEGGILAQAADSWNAIATQLANVVNDVHTGGTQTNGDPGADFFVFDASLPAALGMAVGVTADTIAAGRPGAGAFDGGIADAVAQLGTLPDGPDAQWRDFVVDLGVRTQTAERRAGVTEAARRTAETLQLSQASVDVDEETVNMLAYQRAYEGAARVLTAIDEMLDVLINRTGVVGR